MTKYKKIVEVGISSGFGGSVNLKVRTKAGEVFILEIDEVKVMLMDILNKGYELTLESRQQYKRIHTQIIR